MPNLIPVSMSLWAGIYQVLFAFRVGAPIVVLPRFDTAAFADAVRRFGIRSTVLPPAAMTMLSDDEAITDLAPLRFVRIDLVAAVTAAGPPLPRPLRHRRPQRLGPDRDRRRDRRLDGRRLARSSATTKLGSVGRPHRGVTIRRRRRRTASSGSGRRRSARATPTARRPDRPADRRRLVPHRRHRPGRRRRLRLDRGPGQRHDQPRRPQGVPRRGGRGPPAVAGGAPTPPWSASPTTASARCRGPSSSRSRATSPPPTSARRRSAASTSLPTRCRCASSTVDALPRNEIGKVLAKDLVALVPG